MDSARSGQYCLGSVTAVAIAVVLGCLVAGPYVPKVCLNKLDHPLRQADLFSNPSTSLRPFCPEIRSPPTHLHCHSTPTPPPTEQPSCLQIQIQQAQLFWALTRWAHLPPPSGQRHRGTSFTTGDEIPTNPSVRRCDLHQRLRRSSFNRRKARFLHLPVSACGASTGHRRQAHPRLRHCVYPISEPFCNSAFFEGPLCKMVV
jgi:hypothetical protein